MFRDIIDYQESVRDRTRWIEVGPGPHLLRVPPPWNPAYDEFDEISLIAYAMLPFCAFRPSTLPAIPPEAQYLANTMADDGFENIFQGRAFMRAITCCGGLMLPTQFQITDRAHGLTREMGVYTDTEGTGWRSQPEGRAVYFRAMLQTANPAPTLYEPAPGMFAAKYHWSLGQGALDFRPDPTTSPAGAFNYPPAGSYLGDPGDEGHHVYGAMVQGQNMQTISAGTARSSSGAPCQYNQYPRKVTWLPAARTYSYLGTYNLSGETSTPLCFPSSNGVTASGFWVMAGFDLDALSGMFMPTPPTYYMGEPFEEFIRHPELDKISYPGWDIWRARVAEWCFDTPDWIRQMLPYYRARRPRLSAPGTPTEHWQRMPLYLPWTGRLEYRIWQRVMYVRGTLRNPFYWTNTLPIAPMPPGVTSVSQGRTLAHSPDGRPFGIGISGGMLSVDHVDLGPGFANHDTPDKICLDNVSFPVVHNPPYVP